MRCRILPVLATALALVGVGLATPGSAAPTAGPAAVFQPAAIDFGRCDDPFLRDRGAQCGFLTVPLDYSKPNGATIRLAVSRLLHTVPDAQYQGVMLVNPGGPGGSGLIYSVFRDFVPKDAGQAYDWIGFDPRGVGSSRPALSCVPDYFGPDRPDYVATSKAIEDAWLARSKGYAQACGRSGGALLQNMTTVDSVKDMESLRVALGQEKINFYGFSYGTYLAQVYGTRYPDRVRRMVMDSNVDPRDVWYRANLNQDRAFDRVLGVFFDWVAANDATYRLGTSGRAVEQRYYTEQDYLRRFPAGGKVGPDEWNDIFVPAGYAQFLWPRIASVFSAWAVGRNVDAVVAAYQGAEPSNDNGFAVYNAVQCSDKQYPGFAKVRADAFEVYRTAPFLTWNNVWYNAPCLFWPVTGQKPVVVDGADVPPVLLIGETGDAATPFTGNLEVRKRFPKARLIAVRGGTTHANSLSGNLCVDNRIADYLLTGALPARQVGNGSDVVCAAPPLPDPAGAVDALQVGGLTRQDLAVTGRR